MKNIYDTIRCPLITEKGAIQQTDTNKYHFKVDVRCNKNDVKDAVERIYNVSVTNVHTLNVKGKNKRVGRHEGKTAGWKKAIVTVKNGDTIDFL